MGYAGVRLNMVLAVLAPLVLVIALATALYVQVRFNDARRAGLGGEAAVRDAYAAKRRPLIWTSVTTIVGFGALLLSHLGPVRALGFWCVVSTLEMLLFVFTVYPASPGDFPRPGRGRRRAVGRACPPGARAPFGDLGHPSPARGRRLRAAARAAGLAGFPRLRVEGNALTYLPKDHAVRQGIERLESAGIGSTSVELVLDAAAGDAAFGSGDGLARLSFLAGRLREVPGVIGVVGAGDLVDAALRRAGSAAERAAGFGGGAALRGAALARLRAEPLGARTLGRFLSTDGASARLTLFTRTVGLDALQPVLTQAAALAREEFPEARVATTGEFPLLLDMQRGLIETLAASLGLALVAVAGVFFHLLRSLRYMPLAVVTSLLPVVMVIGGMGWCGVPLDIATVMIASIVLGLAGDDTIHTVDRFRELSRSCGPAEAVTSALAQNAPAYVLTALVRMAGFGVCALSGFIPIHRFGALSALAIALAAITDLVVVAALLGREAEDPLPGRVDPQAIMRR
jgi:predicted RND superfamily exporter protein